MAFVVSRKEVGYIGYLCDQKLLLLNSPFNEIESSEEPVILPNFVDDGRSSNDPKLETPVDANVQPAKEQSRPELNSAAISNRGNFIAISDDNKQLQLWKKSDNKWSLLSTRSVPRKCLQVLFTNSGLDVIAADRGGDVYSLSVIEANESCKLILGHVCAILAVELTEDDAYIITCDRDAKIRVTCYPNTYNIQSYCLSHREFVSALKVYSSTERLLLSGSGDGTVRLWKCEEGKELFCCDLRKDLTLFVNNQDAVNTSNINDHMSKPDSSSVLQDQTVPNKREPKFEKQIAVKCIKYCPKTEVFALLFYTQPHVAVFQVSSTASSKSLKFIQYLSLATVPLDAYFDSAGCLWVLLSSKDNCVAVFKNNVCSNSVEFVKLEETDSSAVEKVCLEIRKNWRVSPVSIDVSNLYKPSYISGFGCGKEKPVKENNLEPKWKKNKVK